MYGYYLRGETSMVKVDGYNVPEGLYYSKEYEWVKVEGDKVRVGITDFAQKQLREIVYVEIPEVGASLKQNEPYGTVESVKSVSDLVAPISGTVEQVNQEVTGKPELLNEDPYSKGWLLIIKPSNMDELKGLMDAAKAAEWHKSLLKEAK
jgi:glycine cleavage system H protein